jgi:hypothetical protein
MVDPIEGSAHGKEVSSDDEEMVLDRVSGGGHQLDHFDHWLDLSR